MPKTANLVNLQINFLQGIFLILINLILTHCEIKIDCMFYLFIYLFGVLRRFQHCTGHITTGSWKGRGNQYI